VSQGNLLRADVDAGRVIAVVEQTAQELTGAAADVNDGARRRGRQ
jgi:hypothetical protein